MIGRSAALAVALTLTIGATVSAGWCPPKGPAEITFEGVICQDPRLVGIATNTGETGGTFTLRFYSGNRSLGFPLRKVDIFVPAESSRAVKRWVKGGTVVWAEFEGERIWSTRVDRQVNVGRCPVVA